ncbi:MAG: hypothetical protein H8K03_06790 [Nitrospira sp.]|jgi:uncharacterized protein YjbJ (UPF0337 family)|nr:hypothetical protein [Nitrospira sp. BO4]
MNKEQFGQFWGQLKAPLKAKWGKITEEDLVEIKGNLDTFDTVLQKRYGELHKDEVTTWAHRRYCHWTGNYLGYTEEAPAV